MAFLKGAWLPSPASLGGSNLQYLGLGSQNVTLADNASVKVANGGAEDGMLCFFFSYSGRPISMGMWGAGNESPVRRVSSFATYGFTVQSGVGGYGEAAPSGTYGTDGNVMLWNGYPQGSWIVNRCGGTLYHSIFQLRGSGS